MLDPPSYINGGLVPEYTFQLRYQQKMNDPAKYDAKMLKMASKAIHVMKEGEKKKVRDLEWVSAQKNNTNPSDNAKASILAVSRRTYESGDKCRGRK